ncbi:MAG TPA: UDP-N-acetylglucosamine 2-epimerase (non-hydrolyzing) [Candidatus Baltobacteraceae bacterium]|jgi:UDP-N-acetylglucosamine 2-epimerase (non-hydrolysing)|nr:UDP-N-acetylglucosamine 2-epimerase (non-hydrolyzing) [Candidatus Baltobacteraceae bacterium]
MQPLKVMSVFGTRPDTIKMAPVVHALSEHTHVQSIVCVTAQHREMLDDLLTLFEIRPDFDLNIMTPDQTLTDITTRVLIGMEGVLKSVQPDVVLVHGDTTTSTAAALAAFYQQIPVGHVEAGLRTSDPWVPYPEEMNRRLTGTIAQFHLAPTSLARQHLLQEHVPEENIIVTGNTVIDAFLQTAAREDLPRPPGWERLDAKRPIILVTAHRRENHPYMREMCEAMRDIARLPQHPQILWPVHPSPRVRPIAYAVLGTADGVVLDDPLDYAQMVAAVRDCTFVLTDSGGIQEEAPTLGKPVLVMRDETERPEGVQAGTLALVGHQRDRIFTQAKRMLQDPAHYASMARAVNPYGDGQAAGRIVAWLLARLRGGEFPRPFAPEAHV